MAPTQEQKVSYDSEADSTTHTLTITEPVEGRWMILVASASAVLNTPSGWSKDVGATNDPDLAIFRRKAPASFGTTVQFGSDFSCSASAVFFEYSGLDDTSPLDQTASQGSVAQTGTTGTTTQASELLIGALAAGGTNADNNWSAWQNSFVEEHDLASSGGSFNVSLGVASRVVSSTGTYGTSATNGAGSGPCGCIATYKAAPDAIHKVADRGTAQNLTAESSTAVDMAAAGSITVGNYLIARLALDNAGGGGAAVTLGVTDPRSNTWTIKGPANQDPGAASAGTTCYIAYAKVANGYTNGDDITFTYNGTNVTAKAIVVEEWTGIHATSPEAVAETTAVGASTTPSISRTPTAAGQLFYGALSIEGPSGDTYTQDADTTDGSWQTLTNLSTTSGTATNNQTVRGAAKFVTGTTAQTWNPTITSRDWAAVALVFAQAGTGPTDVTPADAAHGHTAEQPALTQVHALTSNDATHGHTAGQPTLAQVHQIAVDSATHGHTAEQPTITSGAELTVDGATHAHTAEQPALTQVHVLTPADAAHAHNAAEPSLTTVGDLVAHDATHAHTADVAPLTGTHELVPNDAAHAHTAEQPSLSSGLVIVPADALHAHTAEQPALTQLHLLIAADALHAHAADSPLLTQLHVLVVADALHGHTADQATVADQGESRDITVAATLTAPRWAAAMIAQAVAAVTPGTRWTAALEED